VATGKPRVLLLTGYFDWFSGYQETALAAWFPRYADTEVIASDRVSPMFSDAHLAGLGISRRYQPGSKTEHGVRMTRFTSYEKRAMVWSGQVRKYIEGQDYDLIVQVMPGQLMPLAGTLAQNRSVRVALYGDNSAMWSHLSHAQRLLKGAAFGLSKGAMYSLVNKKADLVCGYTPNTVERLAPYGGGKRIALLALPFDPDRFFFDDQSRSAQRASMGYVDTDTVILAAGKFSPRKRLDLLVEAFQRMAKKNPDLKLLLVGFDDSEHSRKLQAHIGTYPGLAEKVKVFGFVDNDILNAMFNAADIGVWPRLPAITIQQAMGTGLSVVLPRNDLVGHLIRNGSGCYFHESDGHASAQLQEAIESQLATDFSGVGRKVRTEQNAWLGADELVKSLLSRAGVGGLAQ
jgi:hypothetical protein